MSEPIWIDEADALAIHDRLLAWHGSGGVRDEAMLKSALAGPLRHRAHTPGADTIDLATLYAAGIVRNHPFADGNTLTGFVVGVLFLELNGYRFKAGEADAAQAMLELATGTLAQAGFAAFLRAHAKIAWAQYLARA